MGGSGEGRIDLKKTTRYGGERLLLFLLRTDDKDDEQTLLHHFEIEVWLRLHVCRHFATVGV